MYILQMAYDAARGVADTAITDMICVAFFFLLCPGEYTGTTSDGTPFRLKYVSAYVCDRKLDMFLCSEAELDAATSISYTFTTQNNGTRDEKIVQWRSGNALCCPVRATVRRIKHHQLKKSTYSAPIAYYYLTKRRTAIKPKDVTDTLCHAMMLNFHRTGIKATDISARSFRTDSAMAMFFGKIDINNIRFMGRWHSNAMMWYLHVQAQPITMELIHSNPTKLSQSSTIMTSKHPESTTPPPTQQLQWHVESIPGARRPNRVARDDPRDHLGSTRYPGERWLIVNHLNHQSQQLAGCHMGHAERVMPYGVDRHSSLPKIRTLGRFTHL
jgi:hypothetical protein